MAQTTHFGIGKPDPTTSVADEIARLILSWDQADAILKALSDAISGRSLLEHSHTITSISGLTAALEAKMAASKTFALADLTDISGAVLAATGYILARTAQGYSFQSPAALLGAHQHALGDVIGLSAAIDTKIAAIVASSPATLDTLAELAAALGNNPNFAATIAEQIGGLQGMLAALAAGVADLGGRLEAQESRRPYKSPEISIVLSSVTRLTHTLGHMPSSVSARLICKIAELGFSVGTEVNLDGRGIYLEGNTLSGVGLSMPSSTHIDVTIGGTTPYILHRTGVGASYLTRDNWCIIVEAY